MLDTKAIAIKDAIELTMRKKPIPPDGYRDYLDKVAPKEAV